MRDWGPKAVFGFLIFAMAVTAGSSLAGVMDPLHACAAGGLGAGLATVVMTNSRWAGLLVPESVALAVIVVVVGGAFVAGEGTPAWSAFFESVTRGWADLLTTTPPVLSRGHFLVLPYILAAGAAIVGHAIHQSVRLPGIAAVAPFVLFGVGLLFVVERTEIALIQGAVLSALALTLGWLQQRAFGDTNDETIGATTENRRRSRLLGGLMMILGTAVIAPLVAPAMPGLAERERFSLRDRLDPPFDPLHRASPLVELKGYYVEPDDVLFTVSGPELPARLRIASLGVYDGEKWTVRDPADPLAGAPFEAIDHTLAPDPRVPDRAQERIELTIERSQHYEGPWLPLPPDPRSIQIEGIDLLYNRHATMLVDPAETPDLTYRVTGSTRVTEIGSIGDPVGTDVFVTTPIGTVSTEPSVKGGVGAWVADIVQAPVGTDAETRSDTQAITQLQELLLSASGKATAGLDRDVAPGHSWGRLQSMVNSPTLVGFEEQYAALAAIAANLRGFQARVVVGFDLSDTSPPRAEITRRDATAWVEVLSIDRGWVTLDVTPSRDADAEPPEPPDAAIATSPQQVPEPIEFDPVPQRDRNDLRTDNECAAPGSKEECDLEAPSSQGLGPALLAGGGAALIGAPLLIIPGVKGLRRRSRRNEASADLRLAGAWLEAGDRLAELGEDPSPQLSVYERAGAAALPPGAREPLTTLAGLTDRGAFGPKPMTVSDADHAWSLYSSFNDWLKSDAAFTTRLRRSLSIAPFRSRRTQ